MIKVAELRIGNWVNYLGTPSEILTGAQIDKNYAQLTPIPLTPEILEACGFEKRFINGQFYEYYLECTPPGYKKSKTHKLSYYDCRGLREMEWKPFDSGVVHAFPCQYLHQLQNIFFMITGSELTYKMPERV